MYTIDNHIKKQTYNGLQLHNLVKTESFEILSISMEKDSVFPEHASPKDAQLLVLEGCVNFHINNSKYNLTAHQHFNFPKEEKHWVEAIEDSKFLIIR